MLVSRIHLQAPCHGPQLAHWELDGRPPPSAIANDPPTNGHYLLNQKPDKDPHETVMFWFLDSDPEQHEPLWNTIERRVLHRLFFNLQAESTFSPSRLMTFIRKGELYPYGLGRRPPSVQHPMTDVNPPEPCPICLRICLVRPYFQPVNKLPTTTDKSLPSLLLPHFPQRASRWQHLPHSIT